MGHLSNIEHELHTATIQLKLKSSQLQLPIVLIGLTILELKEGNLK